MIGLEQWRASIGLYHPRSHRQQSCILEERKLAPIPFYHLVGVTMLMLILTEQVVCSILFIMWILVSCHSLLKGGVTCIMTSKKSSQLLVSVYAIGQAVSEAISGCLERSVRAMAILLIMAGDVEENPGPLPPTSASPESRAFRHHFASLVTAIADPLMLSLKLYSTGMIDMTTKDKANLPTMTNTMKNDVLLSAVASRVDIDPSLFHRFVVLLKDDGDDILKSLGGKLEDTYNEFTKGDTERCTLNPPPAKQPELPPSYMQPSQPHSRPAHSQPSILPHPNLDPYNFDNFHTHLPPSQCLPRLLPQPSHSHPHPVQPHPTQFYPLSQPYKLPPQPSHSHPQPSYSHLYHSQPPHPHSQHPSQPHPYPNLDPYNFEEFQIHLPHSQPPHLHPPPMKQVEHSPPPPMKLVERSPPPPMKQAEHSPPLPVPLSPFLLFVSFLRSFYDSDIPLSHRKWPPVPKQKFINLAAISREKVTSKELKQFMLATLHGNVDEILETKVPVKLEAILDKQEKTLHCVLVEGAPGVGKTTLSWELCKKWGRGELFQQYTAILLLKLRDRTVQNAKDITDLIYYMYDDGGDESCTTSISQHMIQTKGKDTLIILEGLDELPKHLLNTDQPSIFTRLLSRKLLPKATILVTSRPSATAQLRKGWEISQHIEVLGFTEKDITDYIHNALSPQELSAFDSYLSTYPNIRLTMYIPLNCAIVVEVYRSCQQSGHPPPKTTTELYTCLVQTILLRYLDSHPQYKDDTIDVDKFTDLPPPVYQHFHKLIQMAYDGVKSQQLTFHDQHTTIEHLGFMDAVLELFPRPTKHSVTYSYNFLHLSLQEYLAAYYISLQSIDVQQQLLRTIHNEGHLKNMGRFLAGITKYQGMDRATVKAIIEHECKKGSDGKLVLSPYTLQLLHESGDYSIIDGHSSYHCRLTVYSPLLDFAVLGHCIANSSYKWELRLGDDGQYMQSTDRVAMFVQTLNNHSNPSYTIEFIECWYDAPECVQHLLLELPQHALQQIQILELVSNESNPHPLPLPVLEHILSKMSRLRTLGIWYGAVSTTGAVAMAELIKNNNTLRYVGLYYNAIGAEGVEALENITEIKKDLMLDLLQ